MNLLRQAIDWLRDAEFSTLVEPVVYHRPGRAPASVNAIVGRTVFKQTNESGAFVRTQTRDFLIGRNNLDREPAAGDTIRYDGREFELMAPGGEPVWRWSDPYHQVYRIHTKCVSED